MALELPSLRDRRLVLASASARRAQLLRLLGLEFDVIPSSIVEENGGVEDPVRHVRELALAKAREVAAQVDCGLVIGADTVVVLAGRLLGKPADADEARAMLALLSGKTHEVYTGFALVERPSGRELVEHELTRVHFRDLSNEEIEAYVATGSPLDKAGAYGIQDLSAIFVDRIEGCFYNVVGFPLAKFYQAYREFCRAKE
ncbi:MAG: Maf family protein [bacterium]|nr:Maf family protein [candidate division KSB1 bacterium]MDH7559983.1 Maf family protein [bacterium]